MKKEVVIEFSGVSKAFGKKQVLRGINLKIIEGEIFAILGRSGSGKSTLMNTLLGIYRPDKGKVFFEGKEITQDSQILRKVVGLTTQENSFYDKLSVYENMRYYANLYEVKKRGRELREHIQGILKSVELDKSAGVLGGRLSGGMKRRLDFAISMIHEPKILILDEPTTGLDPLLVGQFWDIIRKTAKSGKTIIVISHIFREIEQNCDRACILDKGIIKKVIEIGPKTDLLRDFREAVRDAAD